MKKHIVLARQRGITLLGLLIVGGILGFFGIVAAQAIPSVSEYLSIKKSLKTIANMNLATVGEIQTKFDATKHLDDIKTLSGKDLIISKRNDKTVIAFAYQKEIPVVEPVFVVIKYAGSTDDK
jgi:Tfp pilus assembly protein PilE